MPISTTWSATAASASFVPWIRSIRRGPDHRNVRAPRDCGRDPQRHAANGPGSRTRASRGPQVQNRRYAAAMETAKRRVSADAPEQSVAARAAVAVYRGQPLSLDARFRRARASWRIGAAIRARSSRRPASATDCVPRSATFRSANATSSICTTMRSAFARNRRAHDGVAAACIAASPRRAEASEKERRCCDALSRRRAARRVGPTPGENRADPIAVRPFRKPDSTPRHCRTAIRSGCATRFRFRSARGR